MQRPVTTPIHETDRLLNGDQECKSTAQLEVFFKVQENEGFVPFLSSVLASKKSSFGTKCQRRFRMLFYLPEI